MITILKYLFLVRFRKLVSKDDYIAISLIVAVYLVAAFLVFRNYNYFHNYILLFFLDVVGYHLQRSDIEILKLKKNYKVIFFVEYLIYSLPFHLVLLFKKEFLFIAVVLGFNILLINLPKSKFKTIPYPFHLFNVYWHICFRQYKLIFVFPFLAILMYVSAVYKNENLIYFVLIVLASIGCVPSFEREKIEEIKRNPFTAEKYLLFQLKNTIINTFYIVIPVFILLCCFQEWQKLALLFVVFIPPVLNVIIKYVYFYNNLVHQIVFAFFVSSIFFLFGAPLLATPFMYKKAIKNLKAIKYADDSN
nr:hypothetical protein [uncultured Flavobacterium sp.]